VYADDSRINVNMDIFETALSAAVSVHTQAKRNGKEMNTFLPS